MEISDFRHIAESIRSDIDQKLTGCGILCRVFGRGKSEESLNKKLNSINSDNQLKYHCNGKKIQDAIGIRVVLYFSDDIEIAREILCNSYTFKENDSAIDKPKDEEFSVTRYNLIFEIPDHQIPDTTLAINSRPIDSTFEVQLRSVLSEGWHEVEHDLRYKQKNYWNESEDLSRALNGIVATLETSEWGMRKIFDDLAYRQYKNKNWAAMLTLKLRMRVSGEIEQELETILNNDINIPKKILRINRAKIITEYAEHYMRIPLTLNNMIYILNIIEEISEEITQRTPSRITKAKNDFQKVN